MNVDLSPELEQLVYNMIQSGRYSSAGEVVGKALRLMEETDELRTIQLQELRGRLDKGLDEAQRGESVDGEIFMQGLLDYVDIQDTKRTSG